MTSYIRHKIAPVQEAFYFVNESLTRDGRYWWFYCAFPPSGTAGQGRTLGVVDFATQEVRHFPDTQFNHASPFVDVETGEVYWGMGDGVWRRGPQPGDDAVLVNRLPEELTLMCPIEMCGHTTKIGGRAFSLTPGGSAIVLARCPWTAVTSSCGTFQRNYNHAQFSPTDPDCALRAGEPP